MTVLACGISMYARNNKTQATEIKDELNPERYNGVKTIIPDRQWRADILGNGYEARTVDLGNSYDGPICCTVVRRMAQKGTNRAVLYVHGFNDYFFQSEMGEIFNDSAVNFYAVDLRRYGRSLRPWQYPFDIRNIKDYFAEIDSALHYIKEDGNTDITLSGHSTGGLTVLLYAAESGEDIPFRRIVTDSPFLQWNFNSFYRNILIPAVTVWGKLAPSTKIKQGHCNAYGESLLRQYHGEWEYDTDWKMLYSPPVTAGWIRAISRAQSRLMKHARNIIAPVLVMHSTIGLQTCSWTPQCQNADIVLNPTQIAHRGLKMGTSPVVAPIDSGMHDLILSSPHVRAAAYDTIFNFIRTH